MITLTILLATLTVQDRQPVVSPPALCSTAQFRFEEDEAGSPLATLLWTEPAQFPNPGQHHLERGDFELDCPDFSAKQHQGTFSIRARTVFDAFRRLRDPRFFSSGGCRYRAIGRGCFLHYIELEQTGTRLSLKTDNKIASSIFFADAVVGVTVNQGELKPLWFQNAGIPLDLVEGNVYDLYAKGENVQVAHLRVDLKSGELRFARSAPFPDR